MNLVASWSAAISSSSPRDAAVSSPATPRCACSVNSARPAAASSIARAADRASSASVNRWAFDRGARGADQRRQLAVPFGELLLDAPPLLNLVERRAQFLQRLGDDRVRRGVELLEQLKRRLMFAVRKPVARVADGGANERGLSLRGERGFSRRLQRQRAGVIGGERQRLGRSS